MGITRVNNWATILYKEIEKSKTLSFEYSKNDCTTWSAKIIRSYTNLDWMPSWKNKKQALKLHKSNPMEKQVSEILGPYRTNLMLTKRGDVVQKGIGLDSSLGICIGSKVVFLAENIGICYSDLSDCTYSWRI